MTFEGKTILITGATGLLGTHLVKKLLAYKDCTIVALGRNIEKLEEVFNGYQGEGKLVLMKGDVSDIVPVYEKDYDYIFHAASPIAGDIIRNYPVSVIKPNVLGTINCLEYLKKKKEEQGLNSKMVVYDPFRKQAIRATRLRQGQYETLSSKIRGVIKRLIKDYIMRPLYSMLVF